MTDDLRAMLKRARTLHDTIANSDPKLARGRVWCTVCGHTEAVNSADCLRHGWPEHCGYTMTIDSPSERGPHD